jgi:DNA-binding response OmpR family regulator
MDDQPSDGNERVAEIFIVSSDETVTGLLQEPLVKKEYRVCVFTGTAQFEEALPARNPDLLIYDCTTGGREGYEVIRRIKADNDLRAIPVLAITAASTMEDLLRVLESNADNIIAPPFITPDQLSLIEGMLATPVEQSPPEEIKKQFRVRQDDQSYVIAATSRKLLEYLLSSFEIVAGKSSELSSVTSKLRERSESARDLEQKVTGQTGDIEALNATIWQKEQSIIALTREREGLETTLAQKTDEIKNFTTESATLKTSLETMENALIEEETRNASLEKTLRDLKSELGRQKSVFAAGKTRIQSVQQEINTLKEAKTQSEKDLKQVITGLNETAEQQVAELARLKGELETETSRRVLAENQADEIEREFEQSRNTHHSETEALNLQIGRLQETIAASAAALETERELRRISEEKLRDAVRQQEEPGQQARAASEELERANKDQAAVILQIKEELKTAGNRIESLEADLSNVDSEKSNAEQDVRTLTAEIEQQKSAFVAEKNRLLSAEQEINTLKEAKKQSEHELKQVIAGLNETAQQHAAELARLKGELEAETSRRVQAENQAGERQREFEQSRNTVQSEIVALSQQVGTLQETLTASAEALETERELRWISEEKSKAAVELQEDLENQARIANEEMEGAKKDQAANISQIQEELKTAGNRIQSLEADIRNLAREKSTAEKDVRALTAELERTRTTLADERKDHPGIDAAGKERHLVQQPLFQPDEENTPKDDPGLVFPEKSHLPTKVQQASPPVIREKTSGLQQPPVSKKAMESGTGAKPEQPAVEKPGIPGSEAGSGQQPAETPEESAGNVSGGDMSFTRGQWLDLLKWARHSEKISDEERLKIVRMGRLVQKDGKLAKKHQDQVREILSSASALGYPPG